MLKELPILGEQEKWAQIALSPREEHEWEKSKTTLLYSYSGFGGILYKMMPLDNGEKAWFTDKTTWAATDGKVLYLNPKNFFELNLKKRIFTMCHEVMHNILDHPRIFHIYRKAKKITYPDGKTLPYIEEVMQCAADCIINDTLVTCRVGELDERWYHKPYIVPYTMALIEAYRAIYKHTNGGQTLPKPQQGQGKDTKDSENETDQDGQMPFDQHLTPGQGRGKQASEAISERNKVEWDAAVTAVRHTMKQMGVGSAGIDRVFGKVTEPDYDWISTLRHCFNRTVGTGRETWEFLDPEFVIRGIGAPGRVNYGAGFVAEATDSSGSISDNMLSTFNGHISIIIDDVRPRELLVCQCDDRIHQWEYIQSGAELPKKVLGGGGTDFRPVFNRIEQEQLRPDCLIYFTDCYGAYPAKEPQYPVIWASITPEGQLGRSRPPFGEIIYIPLQSPKTSWRQQHEDE